MEPPMDADERRLELDKITDCIIGCAYKIGNKLGSGFLEKAYENALTYEIVKERRKEGLEVEQQYSYL